MNLAYKAMLLAREAHRHQVRDYTGNPFTDHLAEVAGIVATVAYSHADPEVMIATAWLHASMKHQGVSPSVLEREFGADVADGVLLLSDLQTGSDRAALAAASRERLAAAPGWVQTIKCANIISNASSIVKHDPSFAAVYLEEKRLLLASMQRADDHLWIIANATVESGVRYDT